MAATLKDITGYLNQLLDPNRFPDDPSNNGLQVEGAATVNRVLFAVDSPTELCDLARQRRAELIFVHHGLSWGSGFRTLTGITAGKLRRLFGGNISLYASHLPLDAHPVHGHNAVMAEMLDLGDRCGFCRCGEHDLGIGGRLPTPASVGELAGILADRLDSDYTLYGKEATAVNRIGILSGSPGSEGVMAAATAGLDALVTGEISHVTFQTVREVSLPVICCGHYKTEIPGVKRIMELVHNRFDLDCEFIDLPTGL
ncbi:MAG: Nif3-like dinuclear metal center hexameric protein [Victivallales bacterium]|nr:Nif3-like dinuclear metal center hexameric protein [Victivallales bacterium]